MLLIENTEMKMWDSLVKESTVTLYISQKLVYVEPPREINWSTLSAEDMGYSVHEIMIIASMIERETADDAERPRIAAVIYNRLNSPNFPLLQIDATIHYAIAGTGIPFSTSVESEFNTYLHEGLPPGPIANPGIQSIRAALFPDTTNEFFYALNRSGTHNFFTNYNDHTNFVNSDQYGGRR